MLFQCEYDDAVVAADDAKVQKIGNYGSNLVVCDAHACVWMGVDGVKWKLKETLTL